MKKSLLTTLLVTTLLLSCTTTKYVAVPEYHFVDSAKMIYQHDSVFLRDSVFVSQYVKGDTVYRDKTRVQYRYKYLTRQDTVLVERRDSVGIPIDTEDVATMRKQLKCYGFLGMVMAVGIMVCMIYVIGFAIYEKMKEKSR